MYEHIQLYCVSQEKETDPQKKAIPEIPFCSQPQMISVPNTALVIHSWKFVCGCG
jgi:hypothetical protein